ncbi:MAG TPA: sulfite exporter TauE/SafE family protein [Acidimicrobiales bacterium]|jgi:hypothetical protein
MGTLVLVALAGFAASLVDGTLGMGFGPTSSTILLTTGLSPTAVSTTVNLAKVVTGTAGGAAHWRFGNVDWRLVGRLAGPGCVGAIVGVTILANVDGDSLRPYLSVLLLLVGVRILLRFRRTTPPRSEADAAEPSRADTEAARHDKIGGTEAAALAGGVTNGLIGAWGPVVTPVLLSRDDIEPRISIGSVNTAEIAVALVASGSLLTAVGTGGIDGGIVLAMLLGGTLAAPVAAWATRHLAPRMLGVGAGALLLTTSIRELAGTAGIGVGRWVGYLAVIVAAAAALRPPRGEADIAEDASLPPQVHKGRAPARADSDLDPAV